jgi:hypothetical protein
MGAIFLLVLGDFCKRFPFQSLSKNKRERIFTAIAVPLISCNTFEKGLIHTAKIS